MSLLEPARRLVCMKTEPLKMTCLKGWFQRIFYESEWERQKKAYSEQENVWAATLLWGCQRPRNRERKTRACQFLIPSVNYSFPPSDSSVRFLIVTLWNLGWYKCFRRNILPPPSGYPETPGVLGWHAQFLKKSTLIAYERRDDQNWLDPF